MQQILQTYHAGSQVDGPPQVTVAPSFLIILLHEVRESTCLLKSKTARITYLLVISVHWCLAWVETSHPAVSKCWFV